MLLLDDDEAIALAVALHSAACGTTELAEASLGALTKVLSILGPGQRQRAETVRAATVFGSSPEAAAVPLSILDVVAQACRDQVRLSFDYLSADATVPRPPPASNLSEYVRFDMSGLGSPHRIVLEIDVAGDEIRAAYGTWVEVDDLDGGRCRVTMETDSFRWPTHIVANLDAPFRVVSPPSFQQHLGSVASRLDPGTLGPAHESGRGAS